MIRIIVDEREKASKVPSILKEFNVNVEFSYLQVGDYIPLPELVIERKSMKDFIRSIYDGRLFAQCSDMLKYYEKAIIIVEQSKGIDNYIDNPSIVYGALASIILDFNIPIIYTYSNQETASLLYSIARRKKSSKPMLKRIRKRDNMKEQQLSLLASLPGIGVVLASRLLARFGSPLNVLNASIKELASVEGMSYAKALKIKKILQEKSKDDEVIYDTSWFNR